MFRIADEPTGNPLTPWPVRFLFMNIATTEQHRDVRNTDYAKANVLPALGDDNGPTGCERSAAAHDHRGGDGDPWHSPPALDVDVFRRPERPAERRPRGGDQPRGNQGRACR